MTERISKSALKRIFKQEEGAAQELALLTDKDLKLLPADQAVKDEIKKCRSLKGGARKRQIKYLAKVMREGSVEDILDFLAKRKGSHLKSNKLLKEVERLRDVIVNEALAAQQLTLQAGEVWEPDWQGREIEGVVQRFAPDEGELRKAVYSYVRTRAHNHFREVFRIIKAAFEREAMAQKIAENKKKDV
jgi:ribosome-associated protein